MAHDSSLPPGSILLRTMPLIVPRYGGALLFMAVHARCSDRSSVLSLFSLPLSLFSCFSLFPARLLFLLLLLLYVRNRGIKKEEAKNGKIEIVGYPDRCYLNLFLMMLNHPLSPPIDLVRVSEIALQSFFQMYRRLVGDFHRNLKKKRVSGGKNWNNSIERVIGGRFSLEIRINLIR